MSTKIYGGLRLKDPSLELYSVVSIIAKTIRFEFEVAARKTVANLLIDAIDSKAFRADLETQGYIADKVEAEWLAHQKEIGYHSTFNDPLRFSIVFGKSSSGNILALAYSVEPSYDVALKAAGLFEDYGYWDNVDQPEGLSDEEWKARGKEWESLESEEGTFGDLPGWQLGSTMDIWSQVLYLLRGEEDLNKFRSQRARLNGYLVNAVLGSIIESDPDKTNPFRHVYTASKLVKAFMLTPASEAVALPEPLPTRFNVKVQELPPIYEVSPEVVAQILELKDKLED